MRGGIQTDATLAIAGGSANGCAAVLRWPIRKAPTVLSTTAAALTGRLVRVIDVYHNRVPFRRSLTFG